MNVRTPLVLRVPDPNPVAVCGSEMHERNATPDFYGFTIKLLVDIAQEGSRNFRDNGRKST